MSVGLVTPHGRSADDYVSPISQKTPPSLPEDIIMDLYRHMFTAREIDMMEAQYVKSGDAFFHVSGAGHESIAALNPHLIQDDWLHCHYRDKALMLARGITPEQFFLSLFAKDASHSQGRQMSAHMSDRSRNILSLVGPVGNNALQAVGVAWEISEQASKPIVICSLGDGTTQQGEVLEAIAEAVRWELPVLFIIEDNHFSISTRTGGKTFYSHPGGHQPDEFYGLKIHRIDGRDPIQCHQHFGIVVDEVRSTRAPGLVIMDVERLVDHTNADDQRVYRETADIERARSESDPIPRLAQALLSAGVKKKALNTLEADIRSQVRAAVSQAQNSRDPQPMFEAKKPLPNKFYSATSEYTGNSEKPRLTMLEAIKEVFRQRLREDQKINLYGEDIEDPKGDVFGLTRSLTDEFPGRVRNSPLTESTIVGVAIGRALAGGKSVAFLQFADFLPLAYNQILSELGSMYWRTGGSWQCPVIIMITCGGYRPGLGPFHAQTLEAIAAHTPGVDVFMPSSAADAAGLLNAAFDSGRPTLFFYPKSCLNDHGATTSADVREQFVPLGKARIEKSGNDLTLVAWGNTVSRCRQSAKILESKGIHSTLIDLRCLSPWDEEAVIDSVRKSRKLVVAHEDNQTCGMGAEIIAVVAEKAGVPVAIARVTRADTFVPFNFANQLEILPSFKRILSAAAGLCNLDIEWKKPATAPSSQVNVEAIGTSPSDETATIVQWCVKIGDTIEKGTKLAEIEAEKSTTELLSSVDGTVTTMLIEEGTTVKVGTPIMKITVADREQHRVQPVTKEDPGTPILRPRIPTILATTDPPDIRDTQSTTVTLLSVETALASRIVPNQEILVSFPGKKHEDIFNSTGINQRRWVADGENALTLAVKAARNAIAQAGLSISDIDMILCSTTTPLEITPALACRLLYELAGDDSECQAHDILAACSGYLYGLQNAYDFLQSSPRSKVLLVTSEVLSPLIDLTDFNTAIIFGDAATATILGTIDGNASGKIRIHRPVLSAHGEPGRHLRVPLGSETNRGYIAMNGSKVYSEGIRRMIDMLQRACAQLHLAPKNLDLVIPHQANDRILQSIRTRLDLPEAKVFSNIANIGNTSSSTIPLCLSEIIPQRQPGEHWGLTAFGGGFTFGACILETL